jgi:hypothetical protein
MEMLSAFDLISLRKFSLDSSFRSPPDSFSLKPGIAGPENRKMKPKKQMKNTGKPEKQASAPVLPDKPTTTLELHPTEDRGVFTAKIGGKRTVVCFTARDRASADKRFVSVTIAPTRLKAASTAANKDSLPVLVGVAVSVKGRWSSGWILPLDLFKKQAVSKSDFALSASARTAYAASADALTGVKFVIAPKAKAA